MEVNQWCLTQCQFSALLLMYLARYMVYFHIRIAWIKALGLGESRVLCVSTCSFSTHVHMAKVRMQFRASQYPLCKPSPAGWGCKYRLRSRYENKHYPSEQQAICLGDPGGQVGGGKAKGVKLAVQYLRLLSKYWISLKAYLFTSFTFCLICEHPICLTRCPNDWKSVLWGLISV